MGKEVTGAWPEYIKNLALHIQALTPPPLLSPPSPLLVSILCCPQVQEVNVLPHHSPQNKGTNQQGQKSLKPGAKIKLSFSKLIFLVCVVVGYFIFSQN